MIKPTKEVLQALTNLRVSNDFGTFLEWLRLARKTTRDGLEDHTDGMKFHLIQGESRCLKAILEVNELAPELLAKHKPK